MKKLIILFVLLISGVCFGSDDSIRIIHFSDWDGSEVLASSSLQKDIDLDTYKPKGFTSLQVEISGSGTAKITHESSNDGLTYNTLNGASDIVTALTSGSAIYQFDTPFSRFMRIKIEETGGVGSVTLTKVVLAIQ